MRLLILLRPKKRMFQFGALFLIAFLAGCAVLNVDVDVYKGPMANHPEVQLQQAVAIANAATPLLVQLRDESEVMFANESIGLRIEKASELSKAVQRWRVINSPSTATGTTSNYFRGTLKSDRAKRVNEILGLYEDIPNQFLANLIQRLEFDALAIRSIWASYHAATTNLLVLSANQLMPPANTNQPPTLAATELDKALNEIRFPKNVLPRLPGIILTNAIKEKKPLTRVDAFQLSIDNAFRQATNLLKTNFPTKNPDERGRALTNITESAKIVENYPEALAEQVNDLLGVTFGIIVEINNLQESNPLSLENAKSSAARLASRLIVPLTKESLAAVKTAGIREADIGTQDAVERSMKSGPELWLLALRRSKQCVDESLPGLFNNLSAATWDKISQEEVEAIERDSNAASRDATSLFQHGRLPFGLNTLTERYLDERRKDPLSISTLAAKRALLDDLVRFAERILFLANNSDLLEPQSIARGFVAGVKNLYRNGIHDRDPLYSKEQSYKYILQAVGNSILIQIDELRERQTHDTNSLARFSTETNSIRAAFDADPKSTFANARSSIGAQKKALASATDDLKTATNNIAKANADIAVAMEILNKAYTNAVESQLTAAAASFATEPSFILSLLTGTNLDENPTGLITRVKSEISKTVAINSNTPALRGLTYLLERTNKEGHPIAASIAQTDANKNVLDVLSNAQAILAISRPLWAEAGKAATSGFQLAATNITNLKVIATSLSQFTTNLSKIVPALTNTDELKNIQSNLIAASITVSNAAPMTNAGFLSLSNWQAFLASGSATLQKAADATTDSTNALQREPNLPFALESCLIGSLQTPTNGFSSMTATATNWRSDFNSSLLALSNMTVKLSRDGLSTNEFYQAYNTRTNVDGLTDAISTLQAATNLTKSQSDLATSLPCMTNYVAMAKSLVQDANSTNRTIRFWKAIKENMVNDIVAFKNLNQSVLDAKSKLAGFEENLSDLQKNAVRYRQLSSAIAELNEREDPKNGYAPYTENGYKEFIQYLQIEAKKIDATKPDDKTKQEKAADALAIMSEFNPPLDLSNLSVSSSIEGGPHDKDALDAFISRLRYEYLRAVEEVGEKTPRAQALADAIRIAYEQRTGMIFIRPASSYLRTSYPATSLQADANIGWKNLLSEHMRRQTPVLGSWLEDRSNLSTILEVDKQFWQNINRVRVAGGGRGNYVIAKDDLGNWYVKEYASDPKDVIKSAKNLAMFSLGPALGGTLPINGTVPGSLLATNISPSTTGKSLLEFQLESFQSNYVAQSRGLYTNLSQSLTRATLKQKLDSALTSATTNAADASALTGFTQPAANSLVELPVIPNQIDQVERNLNLTLLSLVQVHYALDTSILSSNLDPSIKERARKNANQSLSATAREALEKLRGAVQSLASGVTVLNSSLNQKP